MRKNRNSAAAWEIRGVGRLPSVPAELSPSPTCEQIPSVTSPSMTSLKARAERVVSKLEAARCQLEVSAVQAREIRAQMRLHAHLYLQSILYEQKGSPKLARQCLRA